MKFSESIKIYASKEKVWKTLLSKEFYQISWGSALSTTWQTGSPIQFTGNWEDIEYVDKVQTPVKLTTVGRFKLTTPGRSKLTMLGRAKLTT